jgi:hypothetical protein
MLFIAKYRSVFKENFVCPYIPPLKRAGFTDIWIIGDRRCKSPGFMCPIDW